MKKRDILLFILLLSLVGAKEQTVFYEDFNDGDYSNNPSGLVTRGPCFVYVGELHCDGSVTDQRYVSWVAYLTNISITNKTTISYKALLEGNGSPQKGIGIQLWLHEFKQKDQHYDLRMINGPMDSFPISHRGFSLGYGLDGNQYDSIISTVSPEYNLFYKISAIKEKEIWTFFVNDERIGETKDTLGLSSIGALIFPMVGSVVIDDINITIDDGEPEIPEETTLEKFAPALYMHPRESYTPIDTSAFTENSDLKDSESIIKSAPTHIEDIQDFENSSNLFFDLTSVDVEQLYALPDNELFTNYNPKVYGRETTDELGYKFLQYYIFYPFQEWYVMNHEGDWEMVQVTIDPNEQIESVIYYYNFLSIAFYDTEMISFVNRTHPVVLVGLGSHNSYAETGEIDLSEEYEFFTKLLYNLMKLDKTSKEGSVFLPERIENEGPSYKVEEITGNSPISKFEGKWGQTTIASLTSGQKGPKYNPRFADRWKHPESYTIAPTLPFISFFIYSPVDVNVFGDGNPIDLNSENVLLYTGNDAEPKAMTITGYNEYLLNLECTEAGQFTIDLFYYNNETEKGTMVAYRNMTCTETTKAKIVASENSYFILFLDEDGDETYETPVLPDEVITYNYAYVLPDNDNDNIPDIFDNCPFIGNDNQEDNDDDKAGNLCDDDDDNDGVLDDSDACTLLSGDYCNGCQMPKCSGCAVASCPELGRPICFPGTCEKTTCKEDSCYIGGCSNEEFAVFQESVENSCILEENIGYCTQNNCVATCTYDITCDRDDDNDTIDDQTDNCLNLYNPEQEDFNFDGKGDLCDNPRYYKEKALSELRVITPKTQSEKMMLKIAERAIVESLETEKWSGSLVILDDDVFKEELVAAEHLRKHPKIAKYLADADSEIIVYLLINERESRQHLLAKAFYKTAEFLAERENYGLAIVLYSQAWHILNKKA